jgi:hypothetical protein
MDDQILEGALTSAAAPRSAKNRAIYAFDSTPHSLCSADSSAREDFFLLQLLPLIPNNPCPPIPIKILDYRSLSASPIYWRG